MWVEKTHKSENKKQEKSGNDYLPKYGRNYREYQRRDMEKE